MAWLQKRGGRWWIGWRYDGKQFRKSLKTSDRDVATAELKKLEAVTAAKMANAITSDYIAAITGKAVAQKPTVTGYLDTWLAQAKGATTEGTGVKYSQVMREFKASIGAEANGLLMDEVTVDHVRGFLAAKRLKSAPGTVKGFKRILGSVFSQAQNEGTITGNPVALAKQKGRANEDSKRKRPFTLAEVKDLFSRAKPFWQYMVIAGFHTGQSMGDLVTLGPGNVDLAQNLITLSRRKTGKRVQIPISTGLRACLKKVWPKQKADYFWPEEAGRYLNSGASSFSQEFYDLLTAAGLVPKRGPKHKPTGKGRAAKRERAILGFHNLRHTFVTNLKITGAVDSIARELAGHSSTDINMVYTHLPMDTLSHAIKQLPEIAQ